MTYQEVREIKEKYEDKLLKLPNVVGVEVGYNEVDGEETNELAIRVLVKKKVPESQLKNKHIIPKTVEGAKTDVDETDEIVIPPLMEVPDKERTDKWRPIPMGVSTGHPDVTAGSFGTLVKRTTK